MNLIYVLLLVLVIIIIQCVVSSKEEVREGFNPCGDSLVYDGVVYNLYKNGDVIQTFKTYADYMRYFNFSNTNYVSKGASCIPLTPINKGSIRLDADRDIILDPRNVSTQGFNIERFENPETVETKEQQVPLNSNEIESVKTKVEELYIKYLKNNPECLEKILDKQTEFYQKFKNSYEMYLQEQFKILLGYIPMKSDLTKMTKRESDTYIQILISMPNCDDLIGKYYPSTLKTGKASVNIPVVSSSSGRSSILEVSVQAPKSSTVSVKADNEVETKVDLVGAKESDKTGERRLSPPDAPYWNHLATIGKYLQDVAVAQSMKTGPEMNVDLPDMLKTRFIDEEKKIQSKIESDKKDDMGVAAYSQALQLEKDQYVDDGETNWKDPKNQLKQNVGDNFAFTPQFDKSDHMEPDIKSASAYGWSFVPPQFWSVPQKRPPVCIPSQGTEAKVMPIYDQSVPLDALEWSKVMPSVVYDKEYNKDYWYPGWKAMDTPSYPKFSSEYYSGYRAMPTGAKPGNIPDTTTALTSITRGV